ncbi:hypothetical protein J6590_075256 [Homalodisca vitripennis]|nr:hypothetical protein J6590_075256 [Homalodisca vitripennis]
MSSCSDDAHWLYIGKTNDGVWFTGIVDTAVIGLSSVQQLSCLETIGAMKDTSTIAMEEVLSLPSLDIVVVEEAKMAAYRLKCNGKWHYHHASKHSKISDSLKLNILEMMSDNVKCYGQGKPISGQRC